MVKDIAEIYKNIKAMRQERGWTQTYLAKKTGYKDKTAISKIEAGQRNLTISQVRVFAKAFGVTPGDLMGDVPIDLEDSVPAPTLTPGESAHLSRYRALDAEDQDTVDALTENLLAKSKYHTEEDSGWTGAA